MIELWDADRIALIARANGDAPPIGARIKIKSGAREICGDVIALAGQAVWLRVTTVTDGETVIIGGTEYTPERIEKLRRLAHEPRDGAQNAN